jgi:hypothetical protein
MWTHILQIVMSAQCPMGLGPVVAPLTGAGTIVGTAWLTVLCLSVGYERDSSAVVGGAIGFTIEYFVSNGASSFCLFITPSPSHQPTGLFSRYPAAAFVIRLMQSRRLPADTLRAGPWS